MKKFQSQKSMIADRDSCVEMQRKLYKRLQHLNAGDIDPTMEALVIAQCYALDALIDILQRRIDRQIDSVPWSKVFGASVDV